MEDRKEYAVYMSGGMVVMYREPHRQRPSLRSHSSLLAGEVRKTMDSNEIGIVDFSVYFEIMNNHCSILSRKVARQKFRQIYIVMEGIN